MYGAGFHLLARLVRECFVRAALCAGPTHPYMYMYYMYGMLSLDLSIRFTGTPTHSRRSSSVSPTPMAPSATTRRSRSMASARRTGALEAVRRGMRTASRAARLSLSPPRSPRCCCRRPPHMPAHMRPPPLRRRPGRRTIERRLVVPNATATAKAGRLAAVGHTVKAWAMPRLMPWARGQWTRSPADGASARHALPPRRAMSVDASPTTMARGRERPGHMRTIEMQSRKVDELRAAGPVASRRRRAACSTHEQS